MSQFYYLTDEEIVASISDKPLSIRACSLDETTSYLVLTIPAESIYRSAEQLETLVELLTCSGLIPKVYKASGSEDIQIYLSFGEKAKLVELSNALASLLERVGCDATANNLVIHSHDMPFVLPLQPGFAWLNDAFSVKLNRDDISLQSGLALFLSELEAAAVHPSVLLNFSASDLVLDSTSQPILQPVSENPAELRDVELIIEASSTELEHKHVVQVLVPSAITPSSSIHAAEDNSSPNEFENTNHSADSGGPLPRALTGIAPAEAELEPLPAREVVFADRSEGLQLLLFPIAQSRVASALPKPGNKRGKRARSDPSDGAEPTGFPHNVFSAQPTDDLSVPSTDKEVAHDQ